MKSLALALMLGLAPAVISDAHADDQVEDLDSTSSSRPARKDRVREVVRGFYVKANVGTLVFFGPRGGQGLLEPGTALSLSVGQDFIDKEKSSMAWEVFFHQSLNNGAKYFAQNGLQPSQLIQGDIHTFTGGLAVEYSTYLSRRVGVGARAGGGVSFVPLLMLREEYETTVVGDNWNAQPGVHEAPLPMFFGGPTLEYYTKLSHFSVGIDAMFAFYVGLDFGVDATGYLKYTF